ncbi:MAG: 2-oxo acid dehydrogenase subunit E2 [Planctomycetaceae bacterium]
MSAIQSLIDQFRNEPVQQIFRRQWQMAHMPTFLRRLIWWWNLKIETKKRARRLGTFFVSTLSGLGAEIQLPPSVQTGCLTYGPLDEHNVARVTLAYDHRIMDGALVARILRRLESVLNDTMSVELLTLNQSLPNQQAA